MLPPFVLALMAHGLIGGADVILNHEIIARLPRQRWALTEQYFHTLREVVFGILFPALAWFEWHGGYAGVIVLLFGLELWISTMDTVVEWNTRPLPWTERVMHVGLFVNFGILLALLGLSMLEWARMPSQLVRVDYGWASWTLTVMGIGSLAWAVRDARSVLRLRGARGLSPAGD